MQMDLACRAKYFEELHIVDTLQWKAIPDLVQLVGADPSIHIIKAFPAKAGGGCDKTET